MGKIFVSYSRRDLEMVDQIVEAMEQGGLSIWIDREEIKAGKLWRTQIVEAIDTCDAFVLMLSPNSATSDNVRKEIDLAQDSGRGIFILRLSEVKLPADMRYQLAGLQQIDLQMLGFDEAVKQLIETLKEQAKPAHIPPVRQAELVIEGINPDAFGPEKREQLLDLVSELANMPQSQLKIVDVVAGSVHVFVDMPARAAFQLKTMALNRDKRFKQFGVQALRLVGDRKFVNISLGILTTTATIGFLQLLWMSIPSLLPSLFGITVGKVIVIIFAVVVSAAVSIAIPSTVIPILIPTRTPTPTNTFTPTATSTSTSTPSHTPTPSYTPTPSLTFTPTKTSTPTPTFTLTATIPPPLAAPRPISPHANEKFSYFYFPSGGCPTITFKWGSIQKTDVTYTLHVQNNAGSDIAYQPGITGTSMNIKICAGNYQWRVSATRISNGQIGPWSRWIPFKVMLSKINVPTPTP